MSTIATDEANTVLSALSSGWNNSNTDSVTPTFQLIYDTKRLPTAGFSQYDYVLAYQGMRVVTGAGLGGFDQEVVRVTIDVRSDGNGQSDERGHALKVRDEVMRILRTLYGTQISSKYDYVQITGENDLTDKLKKLYRHVIEVELTAFSVS